MQDLTQPDLRSILKFCQKLLTPCSLEAFPNQVLSDLAQVVPGEILSYVEVNFHNRSVSTVASSLGADSSLAYEEIEQTAHHHFHEHPLVEHYLQTQDGSPYKISDFLSERELHRLTGLYEQFLQPLGMEDQLAMMLAVPSGAAIQGRRNQPPAKIITIGWYRSDRTFCERDRTILNLLRPHLFQAYQNAVALTQSQQQLAQLKHAIDQLGLIGLREDGQAGWLTDRAWTLLSTYGLNSSHQKRCLSETLQRWVKHQIALRTQPSEIPHAYLPLHIEQSDKRLMIRLIDKAIAPLSEGLAQAAIHPFDEQYLLLLEEEALVPFSAASLEMLGLTRRESEVLFWVIQDKQNSEIAAILGIQSGTLKKHLEHIYEKLGVQTRAAAVMCALERLGLLR